MAEEPAATPMAANQRLRLTGLMKTAPLRKTSSQIDKAVGMTDLMSYPL
ncbi:hypothetical protein [Variovorax gossypii]